MRPYEPASLGQSIFESLFETSPGRVDPRSGELVETSAVPVTERRGFFDWLEVEPGRLDPRTGRLIKTTRGRSRGLVPAGSREFDRPRARREYEIEERPRYPRLREGYSESMSGPGRTRSVLENPLTWIMVGFGALIALEVLGVVKVLPGHAQA